MHDIVFSIEDIRALFIGRAVRRREHFDIRLEERGIEFIEVKTAILSGEIIEEIPDDEPLPSVLILGYTDAGEPLHIAVGVGDDRIWLITSYRPDPDLWEADYRTRRINT